ncbi:hypothetical protein QCA50_004437 [Cerrena zonata]|uniref:FAD-binding domain-containing protein n=1 Tax=Cerrena zonata TaxID=2478898 RepID=A0AAW0GGU5_9APHY
MTRLFRRWGVVDRLREWSMPNPQIHLFDWESGNTIGKHVWEEEVLQELNGDFVTLHYGDLLTVLKELAVEVGVTVRSDTEVATISTKPSPRPSVTLSTGEVIPCDVIVGADGFSGQCRKSLYGQVEQPVPTWRGLYSGWVLEEQAKQCEEVMKMTEDGSILMWLGDKKWVVAFAVKSKRKGYYLAVQVFLPMEEDEKPEIGWTDNISMESIMRLVGDCEPRLKQLIKFADFSALVPMHHRDPLAQWVDPNGRMVVVGDAAHPIYPSSMQSTGMCVCDAGALSQLFHHLHHVKEIEPLLRGFEDVRQKRVTYMAQKEWDQLYMCMMSKGEEQTARNEEFHRKLAAGLNAFDDEVPDGNAALNQWESVKESFGYDAEDEANEWWQSWGSLLERATFKNITPGLKVPIEHAHHEESD